MPTIKENLQQAIDIIEATPDAAIDLRDYVHPCGTIFCAAGVLAQHAFFVDQLQVRSESLEGNASQLANDYCMWGPRPFIRLFASRGEGGGGPGYCDEELYRQHGDMTDKQLALARLYHALKEENANN